MSIGSRYNIVLERCVFAKIVEIGVHDGPRYVKILSWCVSSKGSAKPHSRRLLPPPRERGGPPPSQMEAYGGVRTRRRKGREINSGGHNALPYGLV